MSSDYNNPAFKKLLKRLQEESWQLELIISGFAIFGLFTAVGPISDAANLAQLKQQLALTIVLSIGVVSCAILIFNLLLHVVLRGLWIGTLGLRYVSGDIDYDSLNYSEKFTKYLKKKVGSFDKYVATLENYCSVIFAISFLLIFYVLALTFTILSIALIASKIIDNDNLPETLRLILGISLIVFLVFGMILTFIDFITQGWLKKKKWISKIYFPVYWVFSFITLSFLYRPLVYNFLDNKFGRRLSFVLLPIYIAILILTSFQYQPSNYFDAVDYSSEIAASRTSYLDLLDENEHVDEFAIASKVITTPYLNVFMELTDNVEDNVFNFNPDLVPEKDRRGLRSNIIVTNDINWSTIRKQQKHYLNTLNQVYNVRIDSTDYDADFILSEIKVKDIGFETYLSLKDLEDGKHLLKVIRKRIKEGDTVKHAVCRIPFWYFKD
ncbi:G protein-coupled receptor family protein [Psychroserpens mesophilus]|uniref:hypothetical protein n=2 Tax=Psychroserpens mesophilus TaxID=325473 RepID=UPI0005900618|nr:hypothetical protein [Psychroserpens mesophilus]